MTNLPDEIYVYEPCDFSSERTWFDKDHHDELTVHYGHKNNGTRYIRAEKALQSQAPEWQNISTAPKDGTSIIICDNERYVCEGHYEDRYDRWYEKNTCSSDNYDGQIYNPIAWQPLPIPPAPKSEEE